MSDDKLFDVILARIQTRELVSLALMTITASSSLVLLGVTLSDLHLSDDNKLAMELMGVIFPIVAWVYSELTALSQQLDHNFIRSIIYQGQHKDWQDILIGNTKVNYARNLLFRILFLFPILPWAWFYIQKSDVVTILTVLVTVGSSILLLTTLITYRKQKQLAKEVAKLISEVLDSNET